METTDGVHGAPDPNPTGETPIPAEGAPAPGDTPIPGEQTAPVAADPTPEAQPDAAPADPTPASDLAPDANEPGDPLPSELSGSVHEGDIVPDHVDQPDTQPGATSPQGEEQEQDQA